jgi:hypothetical protein
MPLLTDDTIWMRLLRLALLGLLAGSLTYCLGCSHIRNPATPSSQRIDTAPLSDPDPIDTPEDDGELLPPPESDILYWRAAPGCTPRPGQPELWPAADLRRDHVTDGGTKRILTWYVYGPEWFVDAVFHRVDGKWLVCFWDTRG